MSKKRPKAGPVGGKSPSAVSLPSGRKASEAPKTGSVMDDRVRWSFRALDLHGPFGWAKFSRHIEAATDDDADATIDLPVWHAVEMQPTGRYSARCRGSTVAPDCRHRWQPRRATVESAFDIQARTRPTSPPAPRDYRAP